MKLASLPSRSQFHRFNLHQARPRRATNLQSLLTSGQLLRSPTQHSSNSTSSPLGPRVSLESLKDPHNLNSKAQHKVYRYMYTVVAAKACMNVSGEFFCLLLCIFVRWRICGFWISICVEAGGTAGSWNRLEVEVLLYECMCGGGGWGGGVHVRLCVYSVVSNVSLHSNRQGKYLTFVTAFLFQCFNVRHLQRGGDKAAILIILSNILHLSGFGDFASFQSGPSVPPPASQQQPQPASLLMGGPTLQPQQQTVQQQQQQPSFADFGSFQASGAAAAQVRQPGHCQELLILQTLLNGICCVF